MSYSLVPRRTRRPIGSRTYFTSVAGKTPQEIIATLTRSDALEQERRVYLPSFGGRSGLDLFNEYEDWLDFPKTKVIIANNKLLTKTELANVQKGLHRFAMKGGGGVIMVRGSSHWARTEGDEQRDQYTRLFHASVESGIAPIVPLRLDGDQDELMRKIDSGLQRGVGGFAFHPLYRFDLLDPKNRKKLAEISAEFPDFKMMGGMLALDATLYKSIGQQNGELHHNGRDRYPMLDYSNVTDFRDINDKHFRGTLEFMEEIAPQQAFKDRFYTREGIDHGAEKRELVAAFLRGHVQEVNAASMICR